MNSKLDRRGTVIVQGVAFSTIYAVLGFTREVGWAASVVAVSFFLTLMTVSLVRETRRIRAREAAETWNRNSLAQGKRQLEKEKKQKATVADPVNAIVRASDFEAANAEFDQGRRYLEALVRRGAITADEAHIRFEQLRTSLLGKQALMQETAMRRVPGLADHRAPMAQLEAVSREHGLPISIAPPTTAGGLIGHVCTGPNGHHRYFKDASYCPEHRAMAVTPVQKQNLPHLAGCACEACWNETMQQQQLDEAGRNIAATQALIDRRQAEPETRPEDLLPDPVTAADEAAATYVPEGEAELLEALRKNLRNQWAEALASRRGEPPWPGHWEMSPAWAADVRKLRDLAGYLVWKPDSYTLYGYTVKIDIAYGAPELKET